MSGVNAIGVMQVLPSTGRVLSQQYGQSLDLLETQDNITAGVLLLRQLVRSEGTADAALAGYYQGLGSISAQGRPAADARLHPQHHRPAGALRGRLTGPRPSRLRARTVRADLGSMIVDTTVDGGVAALHRLSPTRCSVGCSTAATGSTRRIARGGMATVYAATDTRLDRPVAVKVMRPGARRRPGVRRAVRPRGAGRGAAVEPRGRRRPRPGHRRARPAPPTSSWSTSPAGTLRDVLREQGALPPARALDLLEPVLARAGRRPRAPAWCTATSSPRTSCVGDDGRVKVADFGLARAIETQQRSPPRPALLIGTVAYLAPEQVEHGRTDTRTDVYAAGILLFELLTGAPPYASESPMSVAYRHVHDDVPPPSQRRRGHPGRPRRPGRARDPARPGGPAGRRRARSSPSCGRCAPTSATRPAGPVVRKAGAPTLVVPRSELVRARRRDRGRRRLRRCGVLAALLVAVAAARRRLVGARRAATPTRRRVVGLTETEAREAAHAAGFDVEERPAGLQRRRCREEHVVDQDPVRRRPGASRAARSRCDLARPRPPRGAGGRRPARREAGDRPRSRRSGSAVGASRARRSATAGRRRRRRTDPAPGESLPPGTEVALVVSKGVELLGVPDVQGATRADAERAITPAGFTPGGHRGLHRGRRARAWSPTSRRPPDARRAGRAVALEVSKGPELVTVPDVVGRTARTAEARAGGAGLDGPRHRHPRAGPASARPTPAPATQVRKGATGHPVRLLSRHGVRATGPVWQAVAVPPRKPSAVGAHVPTSGGLVKALRVRPGDRRAGRAGVREQPAGLGAEPRRPRPGRGVPRPLRRRRHPRLRARAVPRELRLPHRGHAQPSRSPPSSTPCAAAGPSAPAGVVVHAGSAVAGRPPRRGDGPAAHARCCRCSTPPTPTGRGCSSSRPPAAGRRCAATVQELEPWFAQLDRHEMLGVCLDTCHAFAAGHDVSSPGGMKKTLDALVKAVGRGRLGLVHANDSKDPLGSTRDRHEAIGEGHIGKDAFAELFRHPATRGVPVRRRDARRRQHPPARHRAALRAAGRLSSGPGPSPGRSW